MDNDIKQVFSMIQGYENIPRKRQKFINFCKNVLSRKFSPHVIDKTWEVFEEVLKDPKSVTTVENIESRNDKNVAESPNEIRKNGEKKRKHSDDKENGDAKEQIVSNDGIQMFKGTKKSKLDEEDIQDAPQNTKFDWTDCVTQILDKKGSIKWAKLKKKVINEYCSTYPDTVKTRLELESKLEKKVKKNKKFKISNEIISIATSRDKK